MLSDEELYNLPDDPKEAFLEFERLSWEETLSRIKSSSSNPNMYWQRRYISALLIFHDTHELTLLNSFGNVPSDEASFTEYLKRVRSFIHDEALRVRLLKVRANKTGVVTVLTLDNRHKEKIRFYIEKIRTTLEGVDIPEKKRESLFKKLNAFASEVDQHRTKLDALMSLTLEVSATAGKAAENLKPVRDLLDPLFNWLGKAKEENDALPPPEQRPQIEGPRKQLPAPEQSAGDSEDLTDL